MGRKIASKLKQRRKDSHPPYLFSALIDVSIGNRPYGAMRG